MEAVRSPYIPPSVPAEAAWLIRNAYKVKGSFKGDLTEGLKFWAETYCFRRHPLRRGRRRTGGRRLGGIGRRGRRGVRGKWPEGGGVCEGIRGRGVEGPREGKGARKAQGKGKEVGRGQD